MSKRHYLITPNAGFKCIQCREEFSTREEFASHCGWRGRCKHPLALGLTIDIEIGPHRWTSKRSLRKKAAALPKMA